jgi:hypothetical protein
MNIFSVCVQDLNIFITYNDEDDEDGDDSSASDQHTF